jgi:hypothetical protein
MKILLFTFLVGLCIGVFGCEMHPASKHGEEGEEVAPNVSSEHHEFVQPEASNPNPPAFFPTPESD